MDQRRAKRRRESDEPTAAEPYSMWESLSNDILAACFSYCDAADILTLRRCCGVFRQATRLAISRAESLHLSVLCARKEYKMCDDLLVSRLLEDTGQSLQLLEMSGLRKVQGGEWLWRLLHRCSNLSYVDLSGCANIQTSSFVPVGVSLPSSRGLKQLILTGCKRIDGYAICNIAFQWEQLETLHLGGCSQTIRENDLLLSYDSLHHLRTLDLSGLKQVENESDWLMFLPGFLECLLLGGCERLAFNLLFDNLALQMQPLFRQRLAQDNLQELADLVQSGSMEGFWSIVNTALDTPLLEAIGGVNANRDTVLKHGWRNLRVLDISHCGRAFGSGPTSGLVGLLSCLSGGSLKEVNISGCDNVTDLDIQVLAGTCKSLTCLEARACRIGDEALKALGKECEHLASLDVSACFDITDAGVEALCPIVDGDFYCINHGDCFIDYDAVMSNPRRGCPALRSLKLASLPNLTDKAIAAIAGMYIVRHGSVYRSPDAGLENLLLLDICDCAEVSAPTLEMVMKVIEWPSLVEVNARGINGTVSRNHLPNRLRFLNGRRLNVSSASDLNCCTVRQHSQRLNASQGITLQPMYHCTDCKLLPSSGRGMCSVCTKVCHKDHRTFYGSMTRFYCDCAFGIAGDGGCEALESKDQRK